MSPWSPTLPNASQRRRAPQQPIVFGLDHTRSGKTTSGMSGQPRPLDASPATAIKTAQERAGFYWRRWPKKVISVMSKWLCSSRMMVSYSAGWIFRLTISACLVLSSRVACALTSQRAAVV
jgi:hypothetical protein